MREENVRSEHLHLAWGIYFAWTQVSTLCDAYIMALQLKIVYYVGVAKITYCQLPIQ